MPTARTKMGTTEPLRFVAPNAPPQLGTVFRSIVRSLIDEGPATSPADSPELDIPDNGQLWASLQGHRICSLVPAAIGRNCLRVKEEQLEPLRDHQREVALLTLRLDAEANRTVKALNQADIEVRLLKGLATGTLDYPSHAIRHTGDVDLLVRPRDFDEASRIVMALAVEDIKQGEPTQLLVESTFRTASGLEIDLHHRLFRVAPAADELIFENPTPMPGKNGLALSLEGRLLHAAGHLMLSPPGYRRLSSLVDVAILAARPGLDERVLHTMSEAFGLTDIVRFARWLANAVGAEDSLPPPPFGKTAINRAHLRPERSLFWETVSVLSSHHGVAERARYLAYQAGRRR